MKKLKSNYIRMIVYKYLETERPTTRQNEKEILTII